MSLDCDKFWIIFNWFWKLYQILWLPFDFLMHRSFCKLVKIHILNQVLLNTVSTQTTDSYSKI